MASLAPTPKGVEEWLVSELAARRSLDPRAIDPRERFSRYGLDSVGAAGLIAALSEALGRPLPATLVWDHPTIESLVNHLTGSAPAAHHARVLRLPDDEPIAVVGLGCRFPGAEDPAAYWRLLCAGGDAISEVLPERWDVDALYDADPTALGKMSTRRGGFIEGIDRFDATFFGVSPREAAQMDPQQRLILELAWKALEDAGYPPDSLTGSRSGVFMGAMWVDYARLSSTLEDIVQHTATGQDTSIIAARVSYALGLEGPSLTVNTACSSSLVAVHLACQSLRSGESTLALAGGANLILSPASTVAMTKFGAMAPDGRSKAFDARADGYVRGEGAGVVVLKPLSRALADGDRIYGVIRSTAVNNDGPSNGLTAPNPLAQEAVLKDATEAAGIAPADVDYVEAHGTGTKLGDPIEAKALSAVLCRERPADRPLLLGSVKANIGHLESAAGVAGLIKIALSIFHRQIPPSIHFERPNPHIDFEGLKLRIPRALEPWPERALSATAGVSSFGFGGTNSHAVVQSVAAPAPALVRVAAADQAALRERAASLVAAPDLHELASRPPEALPARLAVVARTRAELAARLGAFLDGRASPGVFVGQTPRGRDEQAALGPVLVFSGNGSQWPGMARRLLHAEPIFRAVIARCDEALARLGATWSIGAELAAHPARSQLADVAVAQPALFAVQVALAELWAAAGLAPSAVVGHSVGEIAAAHLAGILNLEDAMKVVVHRSRLQARASGKGGMAVVELPPDEVELRLTDLADGVCIAGCNAPRATVVSGDAAAIEALLAGLRAEGVAGHHVKVDVAYHSPQMEPLKDELVAALVGLAPRPGTIPMISTVTAEVLPGEAFDAAYWGRNLREPVLFAQAVQALARAGRDLFLEIAPHPILARSITECLDAASGPGSGTVIGSLRRDEDDVEAWLGAVGALYALGLPVEPHPRPRLERPAHLLALSAKDEGALRDLAAAHARALGEPLGDRCFSANTGRSHFGHRIAIVAASEAEARASLEAFAAGEPASRLAEGVADAARPPKVGFLFTGQGSQYAGMGRELYETQPTFRDVIDRCDAVLRPRLGLALPALLADPEAPLDRTELAQPALCALELALAELWRSWGVAPHAVLGHSVGEFAAACVAGVLEIDEALALVAERGRLMQTLPGGGEMAAVFAGEAVVAAAIVGLPDLSIAAVNGPANTVISGAGASVDAALGRLSAEGIPSRRIEVSHAFHSPLMDPILDELEQAASRVKIAPPRIVLASNLGFAPSWDARYWRRHARDPVRVADGMQALEAAGCSVFIEVGPQPVLLGIAQTTTSGRAFLPSLRRGCGAWTELLSSLAELYVRGAAIDWRGFDRGYARRRVPVPTYPFRRERYWIDRPTRPTSGRAELPAPGLVAAALRERLPAAQAESGLQRYLAVEPQIERMSALYARKALEALGWDGQRASLSTLPVVEARRRGLTRLAALAEGALDAGALDVELGELARSFASGPEEAALVQRSGERLAEVLRGTCDPLEALFPGGSLVDAAALYREAAFFGTANLLVRDAVVAVLARLPDGQPIRVLEIGAGTGGTTAHLLPLLPADRTEYVFTDLSPLFLAEARRAFAAYPFLRFERLDIEADIEADPAAQPLAGQRFDLVLAVNVVHATADVRRTLAQVARLLAPGGLFLCAEITEPPRWLDVVWGVLDGWWAFSDLDLRPDHPLMSKERWRATLGEQGYAAVEVVSDGAQQSVILSRAPARARAPEAEEAARRAPAPPPAPARRPVASGELALALAALPEAARTERAVAFLRREVAALLGFDASDRIDPRKGFFNMGLDSLMAVSLRRRIEVALGRPVPTTVLFSYATIQALAGWIVAELTGSPRPAAEATALSEGDFAIAAIGVGCRFPGGAMEATSFARVLFDGVDTVTVVPRERWDVDAWYDPDPAAPGKIVSRWGAFLREVDRFDTSFFGISPREAANMDPQQRLLLEVTWEALENAGQAPDRLEGSRTGVFVGITGTDYADMVRRRADPTSLNAYTLLGQPHNTAAGRVSYFLGLQGPSFIVDTACSSSLVAVHLACRSLAAGECRMALAAGVSLVLAPESTVVLSRAHMLSPDGRCKTFDAGADGYVRGEGCGVLVLKRLADAVADGDRVLAVIRGSAINHDGRSSGFTVPNGAAQEAVIREAIARAKITPAHLSYVEAHGTGTALGDPIEVHALAAALGEGRTSPLVVGSVKTNIGHAEAAAGVAGLIKVIVALTEQQIPPHLHFKELNPQISLDGFPLVIPRERLPWAPIEGRRLAGVSSFGASGTNAHVIVEEPPPEAPRAPRPEGRERPLHLLCLSARDERGLTELAACYASHLERETAPLAEVCATAYLGRAHFEHRRAVVAADLKEAKDRLGALHDRGIRGRAAGYAKVKVGLLFTGQGSQYAGMGGTLYESEPVFRAVIDQCEAALAGKLVAPLRAVLFEGASDINATMNAQPALFALEVALAELWRSWGIEPVAMLGHSVGEYAAACVAGVFGIEEGARLVAERGRLIQALPAAGAMAAVHADEARVRGALAEEPEVAIAAVNGPANTVISGDEQAVTRVLERLKIEGVNGQRLVVSHAFHSPLLEPMLEGFEEAARGVVYATPKVPVISNLTGQPQASFDAAYWKQHARNPVQFAAGMQELVAQGCEVFVEVGPHPVLSALGSAVQEGAPFIPSLRRGVDACRTLLEGLGRLYTLGASIDWAGLERERPKRRKVALPTYPFQRQRYWLDAAPAPAPGPTASGAHPLLGRRLPSASRREILFEAALSAQAVPFLRDHQVRGTIVLPGTAYLEIALEASSALGGAPSDLGDLTLLEPMIVPEATPRTVQTIVATDGELQIFALDGETWKLHATGALRPPGAATAPPPPALDPEAIRRRCGQAVPDLYADLADRGFLFGETFRAVVELWRGEREALGRLEAPAAIACDLGRYRLHPAMLDASIQVLTSLLPEGALYMPAAVGLYRHYGRPSGSGLFAHAVLRSCMPEVITSDVELYDAATCAPVASLRGLVLQRPRDAARAEAPSEWFYDVLWRAVPPGPTRPVSTDYVVIGGGESGLALAELLAERGVTVAKPQALADLPAGASHIVDLRALRGGAATQLCGDALELIQRATTELGRGRDGGSASRAAPRIWLVTSGAEAVSSGAPSPAQAALRGLGRVVAIEHSELRCTRVDLDPTAAPADHARALLRELEAADDEDEPAYRAGERYVPRLARARAARIQRPAQLVVAERGTLDGLRFKPAQRRAPGPLEVEIRMLATGLNFRDVLVALGRYPGEAPIGAEGAGEVVAVGPGVEGVRVGDRVFAFRPESFADYATLPAAYVEPIPPSLSVEEAATIPMAFLTAWYGLHHLARIKPGDRVLVHAAAGGVGMAAVQIARRAGAEVFATASRGKWPTVRSLGTAQVMDSRSPTFGQELLAITGGRGVDVVLNALTGEFIPASLDVLAPGGRFLEIGKSGIWSPERVASRRPDIGYFIYDIGQVCAADRGLLRSMMAGIVEGLREGSLSPLPRHVFPLERAVEAFRTMAQGRHTGKIVVVHGSTARVRADGAYLVTGGLGGLGLAVSRWLAAEGAGHIVLAGRSAPAPAAEQAIRELTAAGARVTVARVDVTRREDLAALLATLPTMRGVIHAAGVVDDGVILNLDRARLAAVLAPKVDGALLLHELTRERSLDLFVLFSSAASILGALSQASYVAANAALDAVAHLRRAEGLAACAIDWGAWEGVGMVGALGGQALERWKARGFQRMRADRAIRGLEQVLRDGLIQCAIMDVDWEVHARSLPRVPAFLAEVMRAPEAPAVADIADIYVRLKEALPSQRRGLLFGHVRAQVIRVLGLDPAQELDPRRPIREMGLDSLMAVELRNALSASLRCTLSSTLLFDYPTLEALTSYLADVAIPTEAGAETSAGEARAAAPGPAVAPLEPLTPPEVLDAAALEALSEAELLNLLARAVGNS